MLGHCRDARFVWNLAVEQQGHWTVTRPWAPGHLERNRQLTAARAVFEWLRAGSQMVQQQALRDFDQAMRNFFGRPDHYRRPTFRSKGRHEGFRIVAVKPGMVRRLNRNNAAVFVPKVGWVRFRWTRQVPIEDIKSYRVTMDRAGRWHLAFAHVPAPIGAPANSDIVGVDRGVVHAAATSEGRFYDLDTARIETRIRRCRRQLARCQKGSNRRAKVRARLGRLCAKQADIRKDFTEKATTDLARRYDLIRLEALNTKAMTQSAKGTRENPGTGVNAKAGLNRAILDKNWGRFAARLEHKALGRVQYVPAAYTSQRCHACQRVDTKSRKSQAHFECTTCGISINADVNAARNIAAGHVVTARRDLQPSGGSMKREPQPSHLPSGA